MRTLYRWLIALAYVLPLKRWAMGVQRFLLERKAPRAPLQEFANPEEIGAYIKRRFVWRDDVASRRFKFWDWCSHPEVTQARLDDIESIGDGDCDDIAQWAAVHLARMQGVSDVLLLSLGYSNPGGGHVVVCFLRGSHWYVLNGGAGIKLLDSLDSAVAVVVRQMRPKDPEQVARWAVFETLDFRLRGVAKLKAEP